MNTEDFFSIMQLGFVPDDQDQDRMNPAALISSSIYNVKFTPEVAAGLLTTIMESIINLVPENEQIDFENKTLETFKKIVSERHDHVDQYDIEQDDEY